MACYIWFGYHNSCEMNVLSNTSESSSLTAQFPVARGAKMAIVPPREETYQLEMRVGDASLFFEKTRLWKERLFPLVVRILHCTGKIPCSC